MTDYYEILDVYNIIIKNTPIYLYAGVYVFLMETLFLTNQVIKKLLFFYFFYTESEKAVLVVSLKNNY